MYLKRELNIGKENAFFLGLCLELGFHRTKKERDRTSSYVWIFTKREQNYKKELYNLGRIINKG